MLPLPSATCVSGQRLRVALHTALRQQKQRGCQRAVHLDNIARPRTQAPWHRRRSRRSDGDWEMLYGVRPVLQALVNGRRSMESLTLLDRSTQRTAASKKDPLRRIEALAAEAGLTVEHCSRHDLNMLCDNQPHQGVALRCGPLPTETWASLHIDKGDNGGASNNDVSDPSSFHWWLAVDGVQSAHNFGALIRSAACFGARGVLFNPSHNCPITPAVSKASAGTAESLPIVRSRGSLLKCLRTSQERGGWTLFGTAAKVPPKTRCEHGDAGEGGVDGNIRDPNRVVLILGNEATGLRHSVERICDHMLTVPMHPTAPERHGADSLNVSVAGSIAMHVLLQSRLNARLMWW